MCAQSTERKEGTCHLATMEIPSLLFAVLVYYAIRLSVSEPNCPIGAKYQYPADCRQYFTCNDSVVDMMACPLSQHFDHTDRECKVGVACKTIPIFTQTARYCYIPFMYSGNTYYSCTTDGDSRGLAWCATDASFNVANYDYCVDNQPTYYIGDFIANVGTLVNQADCGEFNTDAHSNDIFSTAMYIYKANSSNYQFDVELNINPSVNNASGIIYNARDADKFNYIYLQFGDQACIKHGYIVGRSMQPSLISDYSGCESAPMVLGQWTPLTLQVYDSNKACLFINDTLITDKLELEHEIIGWVGLIMDNVGSRTLKFREAKLFGLSPLHDDQNGGQTICPKPTNVVKPGWKEKVSGKLLYMIFGTAFTGFLLLSVFIATIYFFRRRKRKKPAGNDLSATY